MFILEKRFYWLLGVCIAILSLIALLIGVGLVLGNEINSTNLIAYIGFSLLVGAIVSLLSLLRLIIALVFFTMGLSIGYIEMYSIFLDGMSGWGDLVGLLSLFTVTLLGLGVGILAQLAFYLYIRIKKK